MLFSGLARDVQVTRIFDQFEEGEAGQNQERVRATVTAARERHSIVTSGERHSTQRTRIVQGDEHYAEDEQWVASATVEYCQRVEG